MQKNTKFLKTSQNLLLENFNK